MFNFVFFNDPKMESFQSQLRITDHHWCTQGTAKYPDFQDGRANNLYKLYKQTRTTTMAGLKTIPEIISSKRSVKPDWPLPIIEDLLTFNEFSPQITKTLESDNDNMVHLWSTETNGRRKPTPRSDDVKSDRWRIYCTTQAFSNVNFEINNFYFFYKIQMWKWQPKKVKPQK